MDNIKIEVEDIKEECESIASEEEKTNESTHSNDIKKRTCPICDKKFTRRYTVKMHIRVIHERKEKEACHICGKEFLQKATLSRHIRSHDFTEDIKDRTCTICSKVFLKKSSVRLHMRAHDNMDDLKDRTCTVCGKIYNNIYAMKKHRRRTHLYREDSIERRTCNICFKVCNTFSDRNAHIKARHGAPDPVNERICHICSKVYGSIQHLKNHIKKMHTESNNPKPLESHACHICSKEYTSAEKLKEHIRCSHNQEDIPNRTCPQCSKVFSTIHNMTRHLRAYHTKKEESIEDRTCPICSKVESCVDYLRAHIYNNHDNARPYACNSCDAAFITCLGLRAHSKKCLGSYVKIKTSKKRRPKLATSATTCYIAPNYRNNPVEIKKANTLKENDIEYRACSLCDKVCKSAITLYNHFGTHHAGEFPFECKVCCKKFKLKLDFHKHLKSAKTLCRADRRMEYRKCAICYVQHNSKLLLKGHMSKAHKDAKPFVCTHCEVNFIFLDDFEKHLLKDSSKCKNDDQLARLETYRNTIKTGAKKLYDTSVDLEYRKCAICFNVHSHQDGLRRHMLTHHKGIKPFLCTSCKVEFQYLKDFEIHVTDISSKCKNNEQVRKFRIFKNMIRNGLNCKNKQKSDD